MKPYGRRPPLQGAPNGHGSHCRVCYPNRNLGRVEENRQAQWDIEEWEKSTDDPLYEQDKAAGS